MWRPKLFAKLKRIGFGGKVLRLIKSMYQNDSIRFLINGRLTAPLYLLTGVKQGIHLIKYLMNAQRYIDTHAGCNLSPLLFAIFIDGLGRLLQDTKIGISLKLLIIAILFFADDMAVIAPTRKKLNKLINIVREYFNTHRLKLSEQKSKILSHDAALTACS